MRGQVHVARRIRTLPAAGRAVRAAGTIMLAACAAFACSGHTGTATALAILILAASLQVVAEMLSASGSRRIAFDLAPHNQQGQYQGLYTAGIPWLAPSDPPSSPAWSSPAAGWAGSSSGRSSSPPACSPSRRSAPAQVGRHGLVRA